MYVRTRSVGVGVNDIIMSDVLYWIGRGESVSSGLPYLVITTGGLKGEKKDERDDKNTFLFSFLLFLDRFPVFLPQFCTDLGGGDTREGEGNHRWGGGLVGEERTVRFGETTCQSPDEGRTNPLTWWMKNDVNFPYLSQVTRRYLPMIDTSGPVERLFSVTGKVVSRDIKKE